MGYWIIALHINTTSLIENVSQPDKAAAVVTSKGPAKTSSANAARWKVRRRSALVCARRMAALCAIMYTHYWQTK